MTNSTLTTIQLLSLLELSLIFIIYTVRQKRMISALNKIYNVDIILQKYTFIKNSNSSKSDNIIINLTFILSLLISVFFLSVGLYLPSFFKTLLRVTPSVLFCWVIGHYTILLDTVNRRLKLINSHIMNLGPAEIDLEKSRPLFFIKPSILHEPVLQDIIKIKDTYKELCEVYKDIACFYGESILVVILCIGGGVTVLSYFILLSFFKQIEMFPVMFVNDTVFISWATLQLIVFTSYVSLILKESKRTPIIINSLMSQCVVHDKVEKELLNFLRELAFRKIKFTACEIISIDRSFLATAAGTVATYLIILIQFRMSTPSE